MPAFKRTSALVVLSGGQDSTTCLYWAREYFDDFHAVTFDYGQRHGRELKAAEAVAKSAGATSWEIVKVGPLLRSRSPLVDPNSTLEKYTDFDSMNSIIGNRVELTFVPMRNAFFLTLAANIALEKNCFDLVTGVCQADGANYPDCRQQFIDAQAATINEALGINNFKIHTPLMNLSKAQSIGLARSLPGCLDALALSHTCYGGESPPCGVCHACVLRARGFKEAGIADPIFGRTPC
jgi:7-cyano-7-deazaguanine synthase